MEKTVFLKNVPELKGTLHHTHDGVSYIVFQDGSDGYFHEGEFEYLKPETAPVLARGGSVDKSIPEWLFIGLYPNAVVYADKSFNDKEAGDYHSIVKVFLSPPEIKIYDHSDKYKNVIRLAKKEFLKRNSEFDEADIKENTPDDHESELLRHKGLVAYRKPVSVTQGSVDIHGPEGKLKSFSMELDYNHPDKGKRWFLNGELRKLMENTDTLESGGYVRHANRPISEQVEIFKKEGKVFFNLNEDSHSLENELGKLGLNYGSTSITGTDVVVYNADKFDSGLRYLNTKKLEAGGQSGTKEILDTEFWREMFVLWGNGEITYLKEWLPVGLGKDIDFIVGLANSYNVTPKDVEEHSNKLTNGGNVKKFDDGGMIDTENITPDPSNPLENVSVQNADPTSQKYIPKSIICKDVDTTGPVAMLYEMNKALTEIDRNVRGIDHYVKEKLQYPDHIEMCRSLSAEQVDAIAVAIYQIEQGKALIVGDQTGIGKGRVAAGIVRYAKLAGRTPIFFTEKPNLFSDIYRDLIAIGSDDAIPIKVKGKEVEKVKRITRRIIEESIEEDIENGDFDLEYNANKLFTKGYEEETKNCIEEYRDLFFPDELVKEVSYSTNDKYDQQAKKANRIVPFIVNGRSSKTDIKDEDGNIIYQGLANTKPEYALKKIFESGKLPKGYDAVLLTYSQINNPKRTPEKVQWLRSVAHDSIVIMDESHNASGTSNTGVFLRDLLELTAGVCYLSATFAKRPDNMPIYAMKTSIQDAGMENQALVSAIEKGGVALQEILSSALVNEGEMLRRERSYEGVLVNYNYLDERMLDRDVPLPNFNLSEPHKAFSDTVTDIVRKILNFQRDRINPIVAGLDAEFEKMQMRAGIEKGNIEGGISNPPVFSGIFNLINQLLFSIKSEAVADFAILRLKEGKKVVIGFGSTLESFLDYLVKEDEEKIKNDFSIILKRRLEKTLEYTVEHPGGEREKNTIDIEANPLANSEYKEILSDIKKAATGITISPIDLIVSKIKEAGFSVGEVTGRKKYVEFINDGQHGIIKSRRKFNANDLFRQFNDNEIDCLLINQSGATGASGQAIKTKKAYVVNHDSDGKPIIPTSLEPRNEVKQRVMVILQAELDVNKEVQKRGRINRTGQVFKPIYDYIISAIPAEERLMMMLQKKLKSLDANTTSNQKQSRKVLDVVDFLNKYGDDKVVEFLKDHQHYNEMIGNVLKFQGSMPTEETNGIEDKAHKVSGRIAILPVELQSNFYKTVSESYKNYENQLRSSGEWNLEVENMDLQAKTLDKTVVSVADSGKKSVFAQAVFMEKCAVNNLRKPYKKNEVENLIKNALVIHDEKGVATKYNPDTRAEKIIRLFMEQAEARRSASLKFATDKKAEELDYIRNSPAYEKRNKAEKEAYLEEKSAIIEANYNVRVSASESQMKVIKRLVADNLEFFKVGRLVNYPLSKGEKIRGMCLGISVNLKAENPFAPSQMSLRIVLPNGMRLVTFPLSDDFINNIKDATMAEFDLREYKERERDYFLEQWDVLTKENRADKVLRYIVTGNILKGYGDANYREGGKLISYTTDTGAIKKGILLPDEFKPEDIRVSIPIAKAYNYIKSMRDGNTIFLGTSEDASIQKRGYFYNLLLAKSKNGPYAELVEDKDINSFAFMDKWDVKKGQYENKFEEPTLKTLVNILSEKYNISIGIPQSAFEAIKDQFDLEEKEETTDGTEAILKKYNKALEEYERSKNFVEIDEKQFKKLDELEQENYELKERVAEAEAYRRLYKVISLLDEDIRKKKREAMQAETQMVYGGEISDWKQYGHTLFSGIGQAAKHIYNKVLNSDNSSNVYTIKGDDGEYAIYEKQLGNRKALHEYVENNHENALFYFDKMELGGGLYGMRFSLATLGSDFKQNVLSEGWTIKQFEKHFRDKGFFEKPENTLAGSYFVDPNGDGQTYHLIPSFHHKGEVIEMRKGGTVGGGKYDTAEKKAKALRKKGNIITFKEMFYPNGTANQGYTQIIVNYIQKSGSSVILHGENGIQTQWYKSIDELIDAVDWETMEKWHMEHGGEVEETEEIMLSVDNNEPIPYSEFHSANTAEGVESPSEEDFERVRSLGIDESTHIGVVEVKRVA